MKKYELKDKKTQQALEKVFPWFAERLSFCCETQRVSTEPCVFVTEKGTGVYQNKISIIVQKKEVELVQEFNPNKWNSYPRVKPPACQRMRLEILFSNPQDCEPKEYFGCAFFNGTTWIDFATNKEIKINNLDDVRFRPWV